jgi:hypothetical protein
MPEPWEDAADPPLYFLRALSRVLVDIARHAAADEFRTSAASAPGRPRQGATAAASEPGGERPATRGADADAHPRGTPAAPADCLPRPRKPLRPRSDAPRRP